MGSNSKSIITPWSFRDGRDYVIALSIGDNSSSLSLKVTDKITAEEWSCMYDAEYIESLTQRTGSFKPFDIFVSMIKSAILKKSDSVALEMMNIDDLELLRTQRRQSNTALASNWKSSSDCDGNSNGNALASQQSYINEKSQATKNANSKKKYLIVTYIAEFDKVHYPIPLNYSGPPDPLIMQNNIKKLRTEVTSLRNAKSALEEEVILLKQGKSALPTTNDSSNTAAGETPQPQSSPHRPNQRAHHHRHMDYQESVDMTRYSHSEDEVTIDKLISIIQKLEDKVQFERADHLVRMDKLRAENDFLRLKLEAAEKYGIELKAEIHQHQKQIASLNEALQQLQQQQDLKEIHRRYETEDRKDVSGNYLKRSGHNSHYRPNCRDVRGETHAFHNNGRRTRSGSAENGRGRNGNSYKGMTYSNKKDNIYRSRYGQSPTNLPRTRSGSPAQPLGRPRGQGNLRSRSSSPAFDPTAYVTEKRLRQERMAQLRLENIKKRMQYPSSSRSRSNSRDSRVSDRTCRTGKLVLSTCSICGLVCAGKCTRGRPPFKTPTRKTNSVDVLVNEAVEIDEISGGDYEPAQVQNRHKSPSPPPFRRTDTRTIIHSSPRTYPNNVNNIINCVSSSVDLPNTTLKLAMAKKPSEQAATQNKLYSPKPALNRKVNQSSRTSSNKSKTLKDLPLKLPASRRNALEAKLLALHQFIETRTTVRK